MQFEEAVNIFKKKYLEFSKNNNCKKPLSVALYHTYVLVNATENEKISLEDIFSCKEGNENDKRTEDTIA